MRDALCAEVTLILRREVYAGATVYVVLEEIGASGPIVIVLPIATVRFDLHVPRFDTEEEKE